MSHEPPSPDPQAPARNTSPEPKPTAPPIAGETSNRTEPPSHPETRPPAPRRLGPVVVGQEIARTAVGVVYEGFDETTRAAVRIKIGRRRLAELRFDPARPEDVEHPALTPLRDAGTTPHGEIALVQNLPAGRPLGEVAATFEGNYRAMAHYIREAAAVLAELHARGVTHGDISPRTMHLGDNDEPIFAEFGMGLITGVLGGEAPQPGSQVGEPDVEAAPRLERKFQLDERADLYALGAVLYQLLSGRPPSAQPPGLMSDPHAPTDDIAPLESVAPEAPPELRAIASQLLSTDPVYRYRNAAPLARDLDAYLFGRRAKPYVKIVFAVVGALMVGLFGLWGVVGGGPARIVDVSVRVVRADGSITESLAKADRPLSRSDTFFVNVTLSKAARVSVYYRDPAGGVTRLGASPAGERANAFRLPLGDAGWRAPPPGGVGVLLVVSHGGKPLPPGLMEGVIVGAGQPPRSFTALAWRGTSLGRQPEPVIESSRDGASLPYPTFRRYADHLIKDLRENADDVAVGLLYVVGV